MFSSSDNALVDLEYEVKSAPCIDLFDGCACVVPRLPRHVQTNRHSLIASHSHRRKVQLRRQWDGTEDNSPPTSGTKHTLMIWSVSITHYWREITVHQIIITRYFLSIFLCESFEKIVTVAGSLLELLWLFDWRSAGSFQVWQCSLSHSVLCLTNTSSNLLVPSKPTWKLEQKLTFFSNSPACIFSPKCRSYLTQISNCLIGSS